AIAVEGGAGEEAVGPRDLRVLRRSFDEARDRIDGELRGHFARLVAAHAVADEEEIVSSEDRILVEAPPPSDIAQPVKRNHRPSSLTMPRRAMTRRRSRCRTSLERRPS